MEINEKTRMLLDMQENPARYSDDSLRHAWKDKEVEALMNAVAQGKRALMNREAEVGERETDEAWHDFAAKYIDGLSDADEDHSWTTATDGLPASTRFHRGAWTRMSRKVAASVAGIVLASGLAAAGIQLARVSGRASRTQDASVQTVSAEPKGLPVDTFSVDTLGPQSIVFDNVALDVLLPQVANHYGLTVHFRSERSRSLRLFLKWNPQEPVEKVVDKLNLFEHIHTELEGKEIIVD